MLYEIFPISEQWMIVGVIFAFCTTLLAIRGLESFMPCDGGRAFAVEGALSKGKTRGVGIIFVLSFVLFDFLFNSFSMQRTLYFLIISLCMLTGFLDDAAKTPWNEYLKGFLDLLLGIATAAVYLYFNGNTFNIGILGTREFTIPYSIYGILIIALIWTAINVTNCTDGVDGLSTTLVIITLMSFYMVVDETEYQGLHYSIFIFISVLAAYLWYNCNPSRVLMGDAGSRAMGIFIAIVALESRTPLLYIPFSAVIILDGGLGLVKVALLRFCKIRILKNVQCPLHDFARKVRNWSNTQVVFRFAIIQLCVSAVYIWALRAFG